VLDVLGHGVDRGTLCTVISGGHPSHMDDALRLENARGVAARWRDVTGVVANALGDEDFDRTALWTVISPLDQGRYRNEFAWDVFAASTMTACAAHGVRRLLRKAVDANFTSGDSYMTQEQWEQRRKEINTQCCDDRWLRVYDVLSGFPVRTGLLEPLQASVTTPSGVLEGALELLNVLECCGGDTVRLREAEMLAENGCGSGTPVERYRALARVLVAIHEPVFA
jgi:hypothetical protein